MKALQKRESHQGLAGGYEGCKCGVFTQCSSCAFLSLVADHHSGVGRSPDKQPQYSTLTKPRQGLIPGVRRAPELSRVVTNHVKLIRQPPLPSRNALHTNMIISARASFNKQIGNYLPREQTQ